MGIITVLWEKWVEFHRDFYKITVAAMISLLMYLIIFGMGIQTTSHGEPYLHFLIPGVVSPTPLWQFILGQIIGGSMRGMYAGGIILLLTLPIRTNLIFNGMSVFVLFLNGTVFSTIALVLSFLAKSYSDAPRFTSYIIMPMSFLCNTFFSTDQMPVGFRQVVSFLPLSQTCSMVRSIANGESPGITGFIILFSYLIVFGLISVLFIYRKKNL